MTFTVGWPIYDGAPAAEYGDRGLETTDQDGQRLARLTAETTAFSEARVVLASMPMPHRTLSPIAHSM